MDVYSIMTELYIHNVTVKKYQLCIGSGNALNIAQLIKKRAKMALDRSPYPSNSSEQLPRQAF
jgi:hypothetical protein